VSKRRPSPQMLRARSPPLLRHAQRAHRYFVKPAASAVRLTPPLLCPECRLATYSRQFDSKTFQGQTFCMQVDRESYVRGEHAIWLTIGAGKLIESVSAGRENCDVAIRARNGPRGQLRPPIIGAKGNRRTTEGSAHQDGANLFSALIDRNDGELPLALHRQATQVVHDGLPLLDLAGRTAANLRRDSGAVQDPPWRE